MKISFRKFATKTSDAVGSSKTFVLALIIVGAWFASGPLFGFSDTWQLVINTGTTIVTFLMVFLIQNTQNRDSKAIHIKLDEIMYAMKKVPNKYLDVEDMPDEEIEKIKLKLQQISKKNS